jgi:hypothetical protein
MKVVVPFTMRHIDTIESVPADTMWIDVSAHDDRYWEVLADLWDAGETWVNIEHDVVCRADVLHDFEPCPEPWCLHAYDNHSREDAEAWRNALGATRFRSELMRAVPDAVTSIPVQHRGWRNVCDGIGNNLRAAGYTHHVHAPAVHHHQGALAHLADRIGA